MTWSIISVAVFLGYIPLLAWLPYYFPVPPSVSSAASVAGYSSRAAFWIASLWTLAGVAAAATAAWLHGRSGAAASHPSAAVPEPGGADGLGASESRTYGLELLVVAVLVGLLYFPLVLAPYGPYIESNIFLNALHRMGFAQRPYVDFEFLYGPLMIQAAWGWTKLFGYSMVAFHSYLALLEIVLFVGLMVILQRLIPERRSRYLAFAVLFALLLNVLMGVNWSGSRRLLALVAVVITAVRPRSALTAAVAGLLLGVQAAYSHDWGAAGLVAIIAMRGFLFVRQPGLRQVWLAALTGGLALVVWLGTSLALLGPDFGTYLAEVSYLTGRFSAGEAGFRFYWTANSLAAFALLAIAATVIGAGTCVKRDHTAGWGDLLLVGGFAFALFGMKSGLNRADLWHLDAPLLLLVLAFLVPGGRRLFVIPGGLRRTALAAITVLAITYTIGQLPSLSYVGRGWMRGFVHLWGGEASAAPSVRTRGPAIVFEEAEPSPDGLRLAQFLAEPERIDRPVLFYSTTWLLGIRVGVPRTDPLNDDFLYAEERGDSVREFLERHPDALVVMGKEAYGRLFGLADPDEYPEFREAFSDSPTKRLSGWLSTVHFREVEVEHTLKAERWRRTVGDYVRREYELVEDTGRLVVLQRR